MTAKSPARTVLRSTLLGGFLGLTPLFPAGGATVISAFNSQSAALRDFGGIPLYPGTSNYNGDVVEVGYHTQSTPGHPFAGEWVPLISRSAGAKYPWGKAGRGFCHSGHCADTGGNS